jgi:hypothetical protein
VHCQCSRIVTLRHVRAAGLGHDQRKGDKLESKILAPRILVSARCAPALLGWHLVTFAVCEFDSDGLPLSEMNG